MAQQPWVVRPEWVRAHEEFLASDALGGRGSTTRDEQIAAEYVASEFVAYGLKPAPRMAGMIQTADVVVPELDGKASFTAGGVSLAEGTDLRVLIPSGVGASGPLLRLVAAEAPHTAIPRGAIVLLTDLPQNSTGLRDSFLLRRSGAAVVLFAENDALRAYLAKNPNPRPMMRLNQEAGDTTPLPATVAAVSAAAMARLLAERPGAAATLTVHALPTRLRKTFNAVGYLTGSDPASGTILLSAHLDHLGITSNPVNGDAIYNGANDDASGTTAVLEVAHALAAGPKLKRSILFVCYGSEEAGLLGSEFFGKHPPVPLSQLVTNIEFEMIGTQDPKMPKDTLLLTGWERSNLGPALREHGAMLGPDPYPEQHFFERSDNYSLALDGVVAQTAAGWGTVPTYHQLNDDLAHIDIGFMTTVIQSLVEPVRWLAGSDFNRSGTRVGSRNGRPEVPHVPGGKVHAYPETQVSKSRPGAPTSCRCRLKAVFQVWIALPMSSRTGAGPTSAVERAATVVTVTCSAGVVALRRRRRGCQGRCRNGQDPRRGWRSRGRACK